MPNPDSISKPVSPDPTMAGGGRRPSSCSAIAGYAVPCPRCSPRWYVKLASRRRGFDGREFYRGECSQCGWRVVKMISPNAGTER